jgi:hypothetical protein
MELLDVRFNKPQEFIQVAGGGGENVCGVFVFRFEIALRTSLATIA